MRPAWALRWLRSGALPDLTAPNMALPGQPAPGFFAAYGEWMEHAAAVVGGPALAAVAVRRPVHAQGRHARRRRPPGRATPAFDALSRLQPRRQQPRRHARVDPRARRSSSRRSATQVEVLLDGGVRRGSDVVKAVALGARAVMIGRAYLWGLAADGQAGRRERARHPAQRHRLGPARPRQGARARPDPDDLLVPDGFERRLGVAADPRGAGEPVRHDRRPRGRGAPRRPHLAGGGAALGAVLVVPLGAHRAARPAPAVLDRHRRRAALVAARVRGAADVVRRPRRCRTARAASTRASPARCRSGRRRWSCVLVELVRSAAASWSRVLLRQRARRQRRRRSRAPSRGCGPSSTTSAPGRRAGAATRTPAGPRPRVLLALARRRCAPTGRAAGRHRAARRRCCPAAPRRRARGQPRTACSATRRGPSAARGRARCSTRPRADARARLLRRVGPPVSRVALVTGAARGIGAATVTALAGATAGRSSRSTAPPTTRGCRTRSAAGDELEALRSRPRAARRRRHLRRRGAARRRWRSPSASSAGSTPRSPSPASSRAACRCGSSPRTRSPRCSRSTSTAWWRSPARPCPRCCAARRRATAASSPSPRPPPSAGCRCSPPTAPPRPASPGSCARSRSSSAAPASPPTPSAPARRDTPMLDESARLYGLGSAAGLRRAAAARPAARARGGGGRAASGSPGPTARAVTGAVLPVDGGLAL